MDEDFEIVQRIRSGEVQVYEVLVRKYETRVRGFCLGILRNPTEAEDAAQEVFIKAYKGLKGFRAQAKFSTWLYRIATYHCRDVLRKERRHRMESWEALRQEHGEAFEARVAASKRESSPEQKELLRYALDQLPEQYKTVLILREIQGLSYEELAEVLHCSLDAVKARLRRAREQLQAALEKREVPHGVR